MAKVLFVNSNTSKRKYQIGIDGDDGVITYTISESGYGDIGFPKAGDEIDEDAYSLVKLENETFSAVKKAYFFIGSRDRSRREIKDKLVGAGFSREASERAVERLGELGYIDEASQIERAVLREANVMLRGPHLILNRLRMKGYASDDIRREIKRLCECGEVDFDANFERLKDKKGAHTDEKINALRYRYGYEF